MKAKLFMIKSRINHVHNELKDLKEMLINDLNFLELEHHQNNTKIENSSSNKVETKDETKATSSEKVNMKSQQPITTNLGNSNSYDKNQTQNQKVNDEINVANEYVNVEYLKALDKTNNVEKRVINLTFDDSFGQGSENITLNTKEKHSIENSNTTMLTPLQDFVNLNASTQNEKEPSNKTKGEEKSKNNFRLIAKPHSEKEETSQEKNNKTATNEELNKTENISNIQTLQKEVSLSIENNTKIERPIHHETEFNLAQKLVEAPQSKPKIMDENLKFMKTKFKEPIIDIMSQPLFTSNENESSEAGKVIKGEKDPFKMRFLNKKNN